MAKQAEQKNAARKKQYAAPALEKGLDILELMAEQSKPLNLSEIASLLDRSVGEIFRMLVVLEQRGYVAVAPDSDRYGMTMKMFNLAHRHLPVKRLTSAAMPIMQHLAAKVGQSCHLVVYYNGRGQVIAQQDSPTDRSFNVRLGAEAPLTRSCSGHVLLAFAEPEDQQRMLGEQPSGLKEKLTKSELTQITKRVKTQGYELMPSGQVPSVTDIGYPIYNHAGKVVAALLVPFLEHFDGTQKTSLENAKDILGDCAAEISELLGHQAE